jgi:hypothetical protein
MTWAGQYFELGGKREEVLKVDGDHFFVGNYAGVGGDLCFQPEALEPCL